MREEGFRVLTNLGPQWANSKPNDHVENFYRYDLPSR